MEITGTSTSRLVELRKYTITNVFQNKYFGNGNISNDGVDFSNSNENTLITYYIGGIKYIDFITGVNSGLTFNIYTPLGTGNTLNFINVPYYKNPNKENIISEPKVNDDVFIIRQELSAFENNYRLEYIKNLNDLNTYAGGNYFNIVNNT
jgi:hypothetical protein